MKIKYLILIVGFFILFKSHAFVDWGAGGISNVISYGPSCLGQQYVKIQFVTNSEVNNDYFTLERSKDPNFSWSIYPNPNPNVIDGCGTCGSTTRTFDDYGPFAPGEIWYYRVTATSNFNVDQVKLLGTFASGAPTVINWTNQVANQVTTGSSPSTESSYEWSQDTRDVQGVSISLMPTEINKIFLEENNHKINFNVPSSGAFIALEVNIDNSSYTSLYSGGAVTSYTWNTSLSQGYHNMKVRFSDIVGTFFYREYYVYITPKSDALYLDNYCNTMRVWKGNDPVDGIPLVLSEGFDAYNSKSEQYYRETGKDLINCLLDKGFNIYIVNYSLNSQSILNNAAVFRSAVRYVSSINLNKKVVSTGMSMGGVINRYACAKAEEDNNPLPISKFVSLDAPHQGATISVAFQDWRKNNLDETAQNNNNNPDYFAEHASNNPAAKQLLNYNAYDPTSNIRNTFYNTLYYTNGDGFPHLVEKIGVSFSSPAPNPNHGLWLYVHVTNAPNPNAQENESFYLTSEEKVAGSYLPKINVDGMPISVAHRGLTFDSYLKSYLSSWALSVLRPISSPWVTVNQYLDPTFISHNSALDITGGVSKFDKVIMPQTTGYHDVIPFDIIEPLVNALLKKDVYIQNKSYSSSRSILASENIFSGNSVDANQTAGNVTVNNGSNIVFKAGKSIKLSNGFHASYNFKATIGAASCDGSTEFQNRTGVVGIQNDTIGVKNSDSSNVEAYVILNANYDLSLEKSFDVFPNPTTGAFTVAVNNISQITKLVVKDVLGRPVLEVNHNDLNQLQFDIKTQPQGIYFISVYHSDGILSKRMVKN